MKTAKFAFLVICIILSANVLNGQFNTPGNGNPLVPGYFADPTIKKFGDTWYLYATTDGIKLASGDPQVWVSKDFENWTNYKIELPNRQTQDVWAPEVVQGPDERYYYYYSSCRSNYGGCNIFGYVSDTPIGPWETLTTNGEPVIPANFYDPVIPLDPQVFIDDDNSYYIYFCTWAVYDGNGIGWAKMNPDMKSFSDKGMIPNTQLPGVFEAPFMIKKDDIYYLSYSAGSTHDGSYRVMYATSNSPVGTFTGGANNPVTETTDEGTIEAPGHHSFFSDGEVNYIAYHRHDNPHSTGGLVRQVCVDTVNFTNGAIDKVDLTHTGIGALGTNQIPYENLAYTKTVTASSFYTDDVHDFAYVPEYAVDNNNGTIWKAGKVDMGEWLQIDLGATENVKRVLIDFEYPIFYYQYKIEYSTDGTSWLTFADKTDNRRGGSPMLDDGDVMARYIKITITGVQKPGLFPAIWNVRVYNEISNYAVLENPVQNEGPAITDRGNKLVDIDASALSKEAKISELQNQGTLDGTFNAHGQILVEDIGDRRAFTFSGSEYLVLDKNTPENLTWNSPYTISAWVYNPTVGSSECIVAWAERGGPLGTYASFSYGTNDSWGAAGHWEYPDMGYNNVPSAKEWHHIALTFDGGVERVYVDGVLDAMEQKSLYIHSGGRIRIGFSGDASEYLSASLASLEMYDYALSSSEIEGLFADTACKATTLFPQVQLEQGALLNTAKVGVNAGTTINLYPLFSEAESDSGSWSWEGPEGFTAETRGITLIPVGDTEFGDYTVTYINECDISSSQTFTVEKAASELPLSYYSCSADAETCSYHGKVNVAYGTPGNYFFVYDITSPFECSSDYFGDPDPGTTEKECYIQQTGMPSDGNIALIAEASTSYVSPWETLSAINDGVVPSSSTDKSNGAYGNWDRPNSVQWVQYEWDDKYYITSTDVYWFTDNGGLLIPVEAYVEYLDGSSWVKWGEIGVERNQFNSLSEGVIHTNAMRLSFRNDRESTGILEWRVYGTITEPATGFREGMDINDVFISIYPNPAKEAFTIEFQPEGPVRDFEISLVDLLGRKMYTSQLHGNDQVTLHTGSLGLVDALYFVRIKMNGRSYTKKLVIN